MNAIEKFFSIMLVLPSVTFGLLKAEIFPWGLIFSIYYILRRQKVNIYTLIFVSMLGFSSISGLYYSGPGETIRVFISYINAFFVFFVVLTLSEVSIDELSSLIRKVFYSLLVLGLLQHSGYLSSLSPMLQYIVPRGSMGNLGQWDRGVTLLSSEPSRASLDLFFMYVVIRWNFKATYAIIADLLFLVYNVVILKSLVGVCLFLMYIFLHHIVFSLGVMILYALYLSISSLRVDVSGRLGSLFDEISSLVSTFEWQTFLYAIIALSGFRLISHISAWRSSFENLWGLGAGNWESSSLKALETSGVELNKIPYFVENGVHAIRPTSFFSNIALDLGIIGVLITIGIVARYIPKQIFRNRKSLTDVGVIVISLFVVGSAGSPIPWVVFALSLIHLKLKEGP